MRQIPEKASLLTYLDDLEYTEAALAADPEGQPFASEFTAQIAEWEVVFRKERQARRSVTRADAVAVVRNEQLDLQTMALAKRARVEDAGFFGRVFKVAPSRFIAVGLRKQCERTRDLIVPELAKLPSTHPLAAFGVLMTNACDSAIAALDARNGAKGARQSAANDVDEWKQAVNKLRTITHADLTKIATSKGYPKAWADAFFPSTADSAGEESPDTEEPDGPAQPGEPPK